MDNDLFGGAVPALSQLRIQKISLGSYNFGNNQSGLYPLFGNPATTETQTKCTRRVEASRFSRSSLRERKWNNPRVEIVRSGSYDQFSSYLVVLSANVSKRDVRL